MATLTQTLIKATYLSDFPVEKVVMEDTSADRNLLSDTAVERWDCETTHLDESGRAAMNAFFAARFGSYEAFLWTPPQSGESERTVYFEAGSYSMERVPGSNFYRARFVLTTE